MDKERERWLSRNVMLFFLRIAGCNCVCVCASYVMSILLNRHLVYVPLPIPRILRQMCLCCRFSVYASHKPNLHKTR